MNPALDRPHDRVALISGASRGIGLAVARELLARGYRLSLGVRDPSALDGVLPASARVLVNPYEARDAASPRAWVDATLARFGRIDVLVASAGICKHVDIETGTGEMLEEMMDINAKAPFRLVQAAFPALKVSGRGRVICLASLSGKRVRTLNAGYPMSKFALVALSHAIRRTGWEWGIRATAVCPSYVDTDLAAAVTAMPPQDMTQPADLAALIADVLALPNGASVAELAVNCAFEAGF